MHKYRQELIALVVEGTPIAELVRHFIWHRGMTRGEVFHFFRGVGLMNPFQLDDTISEQRRRELQDLSLS